MDNSSIYYNQGSHAQSQQNMDDVDMDTQVDRAVEDMVQYVKQVGKLNKANRQLAAGVERSKFIKAS